MERTLSSFIGLSRSSIQEAALLHWPYRISVETTTGAWSGFAKSTFLDRYNYVHKPCIFFDFDDKLRAQSTAIARFYVELDKGGEVVTGLFATVGKREFGTLQASQLAQ